MKIPSFGIKISLLIFIIVWSVIATGYLAYKNLSQVVNSIHDAARPDYKLIRIKEIASDLVDADNSVRLYSLTHEPPYLKPYNKVISTVDNRMQELYDLERDTAQTAVLQTLEGLISERLVVWDEILVLHSRPVEKAVFDDFYQNLEKKTNDSTYLKKENILKRFFRHKKEETKLATVEVNQEVKELEKRLNDSVNNLAIRELQLLQQNSVLGTKIQFLILQLEQKESASIYLRGLEADSLTEKTYQWLTVFCVIAVILLLGVLFIILNFSRKSSRTQLYLQKAREEAENLARTKELFTANVSHELRTPMNAIFGLTEQWIAQPLDPELKNQLKVINRSASHLSRVVNDILDFSKLEAGKFEIENISFNLKELIQGIYVLYKVEAEKKHLEFNYSYETGVPVFINGDPTRLFQILNNLLGNAFKFTPQGSIHLSVEMGNILEERLELIFRVKDSGIGIETDKKEIIFEDYVQAGQSTNRVYGGTGLGLSIVRKLVELMGGTIQLESMVGLGSTFSCHIPFQPGSILIENLNETKNIPEEFSKMRFLVADDEEYNRMLLTMILKKWNVIFDVVSNGREAVLMTEKKRYDVILMDVRMPELGGFEASARILAKDKDIRIILLTANVGPEEKGKSAQIGIHNLMLKPFSENQLIESISGSRYIQEDNGNTSTGVTWEMEINKVTDSEPVPQVTEREILDKDPLKLADLVKDSGGDPQFVEDMLRLFIKTLTDGMHTLQISFQNENYGQMSEVAHKMASPCRHLGAGELYQSLKNIERTAQSYDKVYLNHQISNIQHEMNVIVPWIESKLNLMEEKK